MTTTNTIIDDQYSCNDTTGRKRVNYLVSLTNPYSAGGESITISTLFPNKFLGGRVTMVNPSVSIDNTGIAASGVFRATTSSTSTVLLQFLNAGLTATAKAGLFVDNTVANLSNTSLYVEMVGY